MHTETEHRRGLPTILRCEREKNNWIAWRSASKQETHACHMILILGTHKSRPPHLSSFKYSWNTRKPCYLQCEVPLYCIVHRGNKTSMRVQSMQLISAWSKRAPHINCKLIYEHWNVAITSVWRNTTPLGNGKQTVKIFIAAAQHAARSNGVTMLVSWGTEK